MSGPPYPHPNPAPGSNAIGSFTIGVSPIGTISPFDPWVTVLSQYANSPILTGMITAFNDAMDNTVDLDNFFDMIWNVLTAQGYGLDVWGRIVGAARTVSITEPEEFLGFGEAGDPDWQPFNSAPFFGGSPLTTNFILSDTSYRTLILAKAFANVCDGSITAINQILLRLFPNRGNCYVTDGRDMTMTYTFEFVLSPVEATIVQQSPGVLPTPAGVSATIVQVL